MSSIWHDPDLTHDADHEKASGELFSLDDKLTIAQVSAMGEALWNLNNTYHDLARLAVDRIPGRQEMDRFLNQCYKLGFVCRDGSDRLNDPDKTRIDDFIRVLEQDLNLVSSLNLCEIRQVTHFLARSEKFGDSGGEYGSGIIIYFAQSGLAAAFAKRLQS
ncbi:hypothetical protein [Loktanella salsilacus]|uniref:hypothetical protein n=1 Tax=Loktanella salsilacus TaxID=195913 RepID=UPI0030F6F464